VTFQVGTDLLQVLGVDAGEPGLWGGRDLVLVVQPHERLPLQRVVDGVGFELPVPQAIVGALHREGVSLAAASQGSLGGLPPGEIPRDHHQLPVSDREQAYLGVVVLSEPVLEGARFLGLEGARDQLLQHLGGSGGKEP